MVEYIEREAVLALTDDYELTLPDDEIFFEYIDPKKVAAIPAADVAPVRRGRWVDTEPDKPDWSNRKNGMSYYCSCCLHRAGKDKHKTYKFCPWCGARMDGGEP